MSLSNNFPAIAPSLNLDFANVKALDPRVSFTRTTTATYYDGVTTAKAEENLLVQSQDFSTTWITDQVSVTANTQTAPDGNSTADTITATAGSADHFVRQTISPVATQQYVFSVFAKAGTNNYIQFALSTQTAAFANFDITAGAGVTGTSGGVVSTSITSVGNDWYRCVMVFDNTNATSVIVALADSDSMGRLANWNALGTETVYLWGAQLEQRSAVSSYTPTTTQPITNYIPVLQTAASGVARFDHNPTTGESLGLLVEEQRTNLFERSEEFDNAYWTKTNGTVTPNTIIAPDGTLTGDYFYGSGSGAHYLYRGVTLTQNQPYTLSCYVKQGDLTDPKVRLRDFTEAGNVTFDISTGTITTAASGICSNASITPVGNGWYRIAAVFTPTIATGNHNLSPVHMNDSNSTKGFYAWGAQLEAGAFPTSYIATTSASVTRNADAATMTGTNFSSWFNNAEGSVYTEGVSQDSNTKPLTSISDGTNNNRIELRRRNTNNLSFLVVANNSTVVDLAIGSAWNVSVFGKAAVAYQLNNSNGSFNGVAGTNDTNCIVPVVNQILLGSAPGASYLNGTIRKLAFYPSRIPDAQLQALTS